MSCKESVAHGHELLFEVSAMIFALGLYFAKAATEAIEGDVAQNALKGGLIQPVEFMGAQSGAEA